MMLPTTSQRIALRFTFTIAVIVLALGLVINALFLGSRWQRENDRLHSLAAAIDLPLTPPRGVNPAQQKKFAKKKSVIFGPRDILALPVHSDEANELLEHTIWGPIAHFDDERYLHQLTPSNHEYVIIDISLMVHNQIMLLWITLGTTMLSSIVGYAISLMVVKKSLRDLHTLAQKVKTIDVDSLDNTFTFAHLPDNDEIQIVGHALQTMTKTVHNQVQAIKQFVSNISHEFKTPLMSLQSTIEVAQKTKQYDQLFENVHEHIGSMQRLLDTLTLLTRIHANPVLAMQPFDLAPLLDRLVQQTQHAYPQKQFVQDYPKTIALTSDMGMVERIITNLLDNAGKFTPDGGIITLTATDTTISIADTGQGITPEEVSHIREPFRQGNQARNTSGFGLGLSLVQQLISLLGRTISVTSIPSQGTTMLLTRGEKPVNKPSKHLRKN